MVTVILLIAGCLAVVSIVPLVRRDDWWTRIFDFPRMQILILAGATLVIDVAFRDIDSWLAGTVVSFLGLAVLIQAFRILPLTVDSVALHAAPRKRPATLATILLRDVG